MTLFSKLDLHKNLYLYSFILTIFFYISVNFYIYDFLRQTVKVSHLDSYLIDQFLFYILFLGILLWGLFKRKIPITIKGTVFFIIVLVLYLLFMFFFQGEVLNRYFAKDDYQQVFGYLNSPDGIDQSFHTK